MVGGSGCVSCRPGRDVLAGAQHREQGRQQFRAGEQYDAVFAARELAGKMIDQVLRRIAADGALENGRIPDTQPLRQLRCPDCAGTVRRHRAWCRR